MFYIAKLHRPYLAKNKHIFILHVRLLEQKLLELQDPPAAEVSTHC